MTSARSSGRLLRAQHGPAITPADPALVAAVTDRLSTLAAGAGVTFTTPDQGEAAWAAAFAERARVWSGYPVTRAQGARRGACHEICSAIVARDPVRFHHVFGYALDDSGGHWRTHSWVIDTRTGRLIEATPSPRVAYIGVELTAEEAAL